MRIEVASLQTGLTKQSGDHPAFPVQAGNLLNINPTNCEIPDIASAMLQ